VNYHWQRRLFERKTQSVIVFGIIVVGYLKSSFSNYSLIFRDFSLLEERELNLCEALLKLDQRNFHCWNHWMLVCKKMNMSLETQLAFTWSRINENASNYSAWHFRGELLRLLLENKSSEECLQLIESGILESWFSF